MKKLKVGAMW